MLVLRCTRKLLDRLRLEPATTELPSTTVLGDWYATILITRPAHLVLLVNERSRFPVVLPARELSTLPDRIPEAIADVLSDLGADASVIARERAAMGEISCDTTRSRSRVLVTVPALGFQQPAELAVQILQGSQDSPRPPGETTRSAPPLKHSTSIYELKITLRDIRPPIWRRLRVRSDVTLLKFHGILQSVMGWMDGHLHQFSAKSKVYGAVDLELPERENEKKVLLSQVLGKPKDSLVYEYDFGDGWEHAVVLEQVLEAAPGGKYPYVVSGKRACPPEDCGGTGGYGYLLAVLADPKHLEHAEMVEWVGDSFDPEAFDVGEINRGFHGGWHLPLAADAPPSKTTLPRQTRLKSGVPPRRR
jgi:hypothetical protein